MYETNIDIDIFREPLPITLCRGDSTANTSIDSEVVR